MQIDTREAVRTLRDFRSTLPHSHRDAEGATMLIAVLEANPAGVARALEIVDMEANR